MDFIKKRVDFSQKWYPASKMRRHVVLYTMIILGLIVIIIQQWYLDPYELNPPDNIFEFSFWISVFIMLTLLIFVNIIVVVTTALWMLRNKGTQFREFNIDVDSADRTIVDLLEEKRFMFDRVEPTRGFWLSFNPDKLMHTRIIVRGHNLAIVVGNPITSKRTPIYIGPINERNRTLAQRLQEDIDCALAKGDNYGPQEGLGTGDTIASEEPKGYTYTDRQRYRF